MKTFWRWTLPTLALAALAVPVWIFFDVRGGIGFLNGLDARTAMLAIFPLVGLLAFTLLWLQLMIGSLTLWLVKVYGSVTAFHRWLGIFVLVFAVTHPILLIGGIGFSAYFAKSFVASQNAIYVTLGQFGVYLVLITALTALARHWSLIKRWWRIVHLLNYVIFVLVWVHSWNLGSDIQTTGLKYLWITYAVLFLVALGLRLAGKTWSLTYPLIPKRQASAVAAGDFVRIASLRQVLPGKPYCGEVNGRAIALFNLNGTYFALDNQCVHAGAPLCEGRVVNGNEIECPLHFSRFTIESGAVKNGPALDPQRTYPVEQRGQDLYIKL